MLGCGAVESESSGGGWRSGTFGHVHVVENRPIHPYVDRRAGSLIASQERHRAQARSNSFVNISPWIANQYEVLSTATRAVKPPFPSWALRPEGNPFHFEIIIIVLRATYSFTLPITNTLGSVYPLVSRFTNHRPQPQHPYHLHRRVALLLPLELSAFQPYHRQRKQHLPSLCLPVTGYLPCPILGMPPT